MFSVRFKMFTFLMPLETTGFFSDTHCENLVELLEVKLKSVGTKPHFEDFGSQPYVQ